MSEWLYSLILGLYPRAFRARYADEMTRVFRDRLRDEGAARVWIDVLADATISIPRQYLVRNPHSIFPPSAEPVRAFYSAIVPTLIITGSFGASFGVTIASAVVAGGNSPNSAKVAAWLPFAIVLAAGLSITSLRMMRRMCRASKALKTWRADVATDTVTVFFEGAATLTLRRSEVIGLHDHEYIGLRVQTADPARDLWVPAHSPSYAEAKTRLAEWAPVTVTPFRFFSDDNFSLPQLAVFCGLALFVPMTFIVVVLGVLLARIPFILVKRGVPAFRKVLALLPLAIVVARWLW